MARAQDYARRQQERIGWLQIKNKFGSVIDEIPIDFPDPAKIDTDPYWCEYLATLWIAAGTTTPPTIEEVMWRNRKVDEDVAAYRMMLEFYTKYDKRPQSLKDDDSSNWENIIKE